RSPCQLLEVNDGSWVILSRGEIALLVGEIIAYICFVDSSQTFSIKIIDGIEWSRLHTNLLAINHSRLIAFNFAIGYEQDCDTIEAFLLNGVRLVMNKIIHRLHCLDNILRNGAYKIGNYVGVSPIKHSRDDIIQIGLPDSVEHKATVRLENGWMTAKYTCDADPRTIGVIAASGVEPCRIFASSLD
uniref:Uncharacterized protein n=1 Tax=Parascaris univalens TaxID=6257 RepID=A0A915BSR9_PARUN